MNDLEVIVIGGGVIGSWTAYHLSKKGVKTLLIDQFYLPHCRGSSNGQTRFLRYSKNKEEYSVMLNETFQLWNQAEKDSKTQLILKTGFLTIQNGKAPEIRENRTFFDKNQVPYKHFKGSEIRFNYPMLNYGPEYEAIFDTKSCVLLGNKCVAALQRMFLENGGRIIDGRKVTNIRETFNGKVKVETGDNHLIARKVIITAGPWSTDLLDKTNLHLPLRTLSGRQYYFKQTNLGMHQSMPAMIDSLEMQENYQFFYANPEAEYPGLVKVASRGEPILKYCHPDERDCDNDEMLTLVCQYVKKHFPYLENKPSIVEPCIYTMTPDHDFIVDRHPHMQNVYLGAGFSGAGFKFAPVVGKLLSEMALDLPLSYNIDIFRLSRFAGGRQSKL